MPQILTYHLTLLSYATYEGTLVMVVQTRRALYALPPPERRRSALYWRLSTKTVCPSPSKRKKALSAGYCDRYQWHHQKSFAESDIASILTRDHFANTRNGFRNFQNHQRQRWFCDFRAVNNNPPPRPEVPGHPPHYR